MTTMNAEDRLNKLLLDAKNRVYKQRANDTTGKYNEYQKKLMKERRAKSKLENKDADNKKNAEYQKKYRDNLKQQATKIKALNTISNAVKISKAKKELEDLRDLKDQKATEDLLKSITKEAIDIATTKTTKKGRPKGSKNKPVEPKTYNLRSRGK
jgi:hypothetical protein